jgi:hypothetical protein
MCVAPEPEPGPWGARTDWASWIGCMAAGAAGALGAHGALGTQDATTPRVTPGPAAAIFQLLAPHIRRPRGRSGHAAPSASKSPETAFEFLPCPLPPRQLARGMPFGARWINQMQAAAAAPPPAGPLLRRAPPRQQCGPSTPPHMMCSHGTRTTAPYSTARARVRSAPPAARCALPGPPTRRGACNTLELEQERGS